MDFPTRTAFLALLTLTACSCSNDGASDSQGGGADGDSGHGDSSGSADGGDAAGDSGDGEAGSTDLPEPEPFDCALACTTLAEGGCLTTDACLTTCEVASPDWTEPLREAFTSCVANDPLCFTSLDQCLMQTIHPPGSAFPLSFTGLGFDAYDGLTIRVWHDPDKPIDFDGSAAIVEGAFAFEWTEPVPVSASAGPLLLWYVDVDANGSCSPADVKSAITLDWNQNLLEPAYAVEIQPPDTNANFVCDFVP